MSKPTRASHPIYGLLPMEFEVFDSLAELALDMRWSWNYFEAFKDITRTRIDRQDYIDYHLTSRHY